MNNEYFHFLDSIVNKRAFEVLTNNDVVISRFKDPTDLDPDERRSIIEAAYLYGYYQMTHIDHAAYWEYRIPEWLIYRLAIIERKLAWMRKGPGVHVWFDSPMSVLCKALHDYIAIGHEMNGADLFFIYELHDIMMEAFICGLAVATGMTMENTEF